MEIQSKNIILKDLKYLKIIYDSELDQFDIFTIDKKTGKKRHARMDRYQMQSTNLAFERVQRRNYFRKKKK